MWYSRLVVGSSRVRCRIRIICHVMIDGRFTGGSGLYLLGVEVWVVVVKEAIFSEEGI